jgi:pantothenate kinase
MLIIDLKRSKSDSEKIAQLLKRIEDKIDVAMIQMDGFTIRLNEVEKTSKK